MILRDLKAIFIAKEKVGQDAVKYLWSKTRYLLINTGNLSKLKGIWE